MPSLHIPQSGTDKIDSLRSSASEKYGMKMRETVKKVLTSEDDENLESILLKVFTENKHKVLRGFFIRHPVCWIDLLRKLHKYKKKDLADEWFIEESDIEEVYKSLLVRGRTNTNNLGPDLRKILPHAITENQALLEYASKQPSLLDSGGYAYSKLGKNERKKTTAGLISTGLIQNIDLCNYNNRDEYFKRVFPKMLTYLKEIFGILPNLGFCQTIEQLSKELEKMFDSGKGDERENAFRVIQAFYAWSSIEQIEEMYNNACAIVQEVPSHIKQKTGFKITNHEPPKLEDGVIKYSGKLNLHERECIVNWRVKSIKSILQKMWITEEYTNIDAIRDMLGISIVMPDETNEEERVHIIGKFMSLMPDYGYLLKNKGLFSNEALQKIQTIASLKNKIPIYTTSKRGDSTDEKFNNASLSGYMKISDLDLGAEVQISTKSSMEWKVMDDKWYKPKDAILGLIRGTKFGTPGQFYRLLNQKIDISTMEHLGVGSINEIIIQLIKDSFIIPYVSDDGSIILLGCKGKKREFIFNKKFPTMKECTEGSEHYGELIKYLSRIKP